MKPASLFHSFFLLTGTIEAVLYAVPQCVGLLHVPLVIVCLLNAAQKINFLYIRQVHACTSFRNHPAVSWKAAGHVPAFETASDTLALRNTHHDSTFDWLVDWLLIGLAPRPGEASEGGSSETGDC